MLLVKHFAVIAALVAAFPFASSATTLSADAVACMSKKQLFRYERLAAAGEEHFVKDMRDRAQCYITGRTHNVAVLDTSGETSRVELERGHRVWVNNASLAAE